MTGRLGLSGVKLGTVMDDMIERVADAIATVGLDSDGDNLAERQARAAIAAMREPSPEMRNAGHAQNCINPATVWQAMIDATLSVEEEEIGRDRER